MRKIGDLDVRLLVEAIIVGLMLIFVYLIVSSLVGN